MTAPIGPADLDRAFAWCERVTRERAGNFYHGLKLTPTRKRAALFALYAWMREADDLVDGGAAGLRGQPSAVSHRPSGGDRLPATPGDSGAHAVSHECRSALDQFRADTDASLAGQPASSPSPLWVALSAVARDFPIRRQHFHDMIDGQIADLTVRSYATFEDLRAYCYRVASTVGLLCISIWGYSDPAAERHAVDRGVAFQLTNILRDVAEDFDGGRVYLPGEDFERHGLTPEVLRHWRAPDRCARFMAEQVQRARDHYVRSTPLEGLIEPDCRPVLWAMTTIYASLLEKIGRHPRRAATGGRVRLSAFRKGLIALEATRRTYLSAGAGAGA